MPRHTTLVVRVLLAGLAGAAPAQTAPPAGPRPEPDTLILEPIGALGPGAGDEVSGIVASRRHPGVYWTLNDSGNEPRVYPVGVDGGVILSVRYPDLPGTVIGGAIDCDWEDIALDGSGRLIVADMGNNSNARRDLTLYFVEEPEPTEGRTTYTSKLAVRYPDQDAWPAPRDNFNFDCEAVFTVGDEVYLLTKHRSDTRTTLYRLDARKPDEVNTLTALGSFDIRGQATGADCSPDGLRLAVLTYTHVWLFERDDLGRPFFEGRVSRRAYAYTDGESDSESVCFGDAANLLIADEARGKLYRFPLAALQGVGAGGGTE
jgi:hypothetical protein